MILLKKGGYLSDTQMVTAPLGYVYNTLDGSCSGMETRSESGTFVRTYNPKFREDHCAMHIAMLRSYDPESELSFMELVFVPLLVAVRTGNRLIRCKVNS